MEEEGEEAELESLRALLGAVACATDELPVDKPGWTELHRSLVFKLSRAARSDRRVHRCGAVGVIAAPASPASPAGVLPPGRGVLPGDELRRSDAAARAA